jgi:hypothetical protein
MSSITTYLRKLYDLFQCLVFGLLGNLFRLALLAIALSVVGNFILVRVVSTREDPNFAPKSDYGLVPIESFKPKWIGEGIE